MPADETVTIINKSGKIVSTGKQLVSIFREAKAAYDEKKDELRYEQHARIRARNSERLREARMETRSVASTHRSHRSRRSHRPDDDTPSRPPLTAENLSYVTEGTVISCSTYRSRSYHHDHRTSHSPPPNYRSPFVSTELSRPSIARRHTAGPTNSYLANLPPPYTSQLIRTVSNPQINPESEIDMNLAYGSLPPDLRIYEAEDHNQEWELETTLGKLDELLLEAHCLQHSASAIISTLQTNPEAMAAVALTLAELSTIVTKMGPSVLSALRIACPSIFALLASPQFLIAGGLAVGVTVVMFGGFQIIKKMNTDKEKREAGSMQMAMVYDDFEMGSIKSWRRGVAEAEVQSICTSVDGEFITPAAARQRKERNLEKRREEICYEEDESVASRRTHRTSRQKEVQTAASQIVPSVAGSSRRSQKSGTKLASPPASTVAPSEARSKRSHKSSKYREISPSSSVSQVVPSEARTRRSHKSSKLKEDSASSASKVAPSESGSKRSHKSSKPKEDSASKVAPSEAGSKRSHKSSKPKRDSESQVAPSEAGSRRSHKSSKSRSKVGSEKEEKKSKLSTLATIFEKQKGARSALSFKSKSINLIDL